MSEAHSTDSPCVATTEVRMYGYPDDTGPLERNHLAKLEIVVRDEEVDPVIDIILKHAQTGCTKNGGF